LPLDSWSGLRVKAGGRGCLKLRRRDGGTSEAVSNFWSQGRTSRWLPRQVSLIRIKEAIEQERGSSPHDANGWHMRTPKR
jgi:hypothetical protein